MSEASKLEVVGVLYRTFDTQKVTASLDKREFVIETEEQYPQLVKFELVNDKCRLLDGMNTGERIKVSFNLRGREWKKDASTTVFFTTLQAWRLEKVDGGVSNNVGGDKGTYPPPPTTGPSTPDAGDDLPF